MNSLLKELSVWICLLGKILSSFNGFEWFYFQVKQTLYSLYDPNTYITLYLSKNSSIHLLSEWVGRCVWGGVVGLPVQIGTVTLTDQHHLSCFNATKWTVPFSSANEMDASPPHMGKSATDHWLRSWQWFLRIHFNKADASWHGAWSQAVHFILDIERFSNFNKR